MVNVTNNQDLLWGVLCVLVISLLSESSPVSGALSADLDNTINADEFQNLMQSLNSDDDIRGMD